MVWMLRFPCIMRNCDLIRVTCGADDHYGHDDKKKSCTCTCTCILDLELPSMMYRICIVHIVHPDLSDPGFLMVCCYMFHTYMSGSNPLAYSLSSNPLA